MKPIHAAVLVASLVALLAACAVAPAPETASSTTDPGGCSTPAAFAVYPSSSSTHWAVCFTPGGKCAAMVVDLVDSARRVVLVQAYQLTSRPIAAALVAARRRGIRVRVLVDRSQVIERDSRVRELVAAGVPVAVELGQPGIAHNKVMIVDRAVVLTGSFNFTWAAEHRNAENLLIIRNRTLAARYVANWRRLAKTSLPVRRRSRRRRR